MMTDVLTWLATTFFYVLGAYVGAVSGLVYGGFSALAHVLRGAVATPLFLFDEVASAYERGGGGPGARPPQQRPAPAMRKKKLAEPPRGGEAVAGAPAGASYAYGAGGGDRGLLG
jgi:hypothetical protein